ncbi:ET module [Ancylostoma ceylanicum]|uniref:ET module n=1 Tax=Ancylostoma ceylanicum TaxID=53326 RepID=A0A0D6LKZ7_9BILA|nr:ET module [Ancylostoma ceylanicum]
MSYDDENNLFSYQSCKGQCASLTLTTTLQGQTHNATMYTCDPTSVCKSLNMSNQCVTLESGVSGCCCNSDACLTPKKSPGNPLQCYVGLSAPNVGVNVGAEVFCDGMCSSLSGKVNGDSITTFQCVPTSVCKSLGVDNACAGLPGDREVNGCCCDYKNSCSLELANRTDSPANPLTCYVGLSAPMANINIGAEVNCNGMCSSLNAKVNGDNVTTFQCVPRSVCKSFSAYNSCNSLKGDREVTGCCCDTANACNLASRPDIIPPTPAPNTDFPISCWSGIYVNGNPLSNPG